jgi:hypothetical protein
VDYCSRFSDCSPLLSFHSCSNQAGSVLNSPKLFMKLLTSLRFPSFSTHHSVVEPHGDHKVWKFRNFIVRNGNAFQVSQKLESVGQRSQQVFVNSQLLKSTKKNKRSFIRKSSRLGFAVGGEDDASLKVKTFINYPQLHCMRKNHRNREEIEMHK